jgi:glycosyltransferase involved in cell wall biosynthesis
MSDKKPIRILRIIARLNIGGPAIQAITLSGHFSRGMYRSLLVCGQVSPYEGDMSYLADSKGIQPVVLPRLGRDISPLDDFYSLKDLGRIISRYKPHIIHTHTAKAGTLGRLAGLGQNIRGVWKQKIRLVHTFHGHVFHSYFSQPKTFAFIQIEKILARFTDRLIVVSLLQKKDICKRYRIARSDKVRTIPLGFDLARFRDPQTSGADVRKKFFPQFSADYFLVGIVGRLTSVKNHRMLLDAAKCLKDAGKDQLFRFLIVGDGELRSMLMNYASELGLEKSVVFTGWQTEMPSIYSALDTVALTSLNEGTPVTLIEAMAAGKPVVATDVGGVRDLMGAVDKGGNGAYKLAQNGIIIPSESGETLANALLFLRKNEDFSKRVAKQAQVFALNRFSQERMVEDHERLYRALVRP